MLTRYFTSALIVLFMASGVATTCAAQATNVADAIHATSSGDYDTAFNLWQDLAKHGDAIAQYNLGVFYKQGYGVNANQTLASRWFLAAARQGLVEANRHLTTGAVTPAAYTSRPRVETAQATQKNPEEWVVQQNPRYYTLQIASSRDVEKIRSYFEEFSLNGKAGYYKSVRDGEDWYNLVYGSYSSVDEANAAIAQLPEEVRRWSPWVRKFIGVQKVIAN